MGLSWYSNAEVVSYEPEKIKELVEQIPKKSDTTSVYNPKIEDNSVFFSSAGYGCYGVAGECNRELLFEQLFEQYDGPLICFEYVSPCQSQDYFFNSTWAKPKGKINWEDYNSYLQFSRAFIIGYDLDETDYSTHYGGSPDGPDILPQKLNLDSVDHKVSLRQAIATKIHKFKLCSRRRER